MKKNNNTIASPMGRFIPLFFACMVTLSAFWTHSLYGQNGLRLLGNINVPHGGDYSGNWGYTAPNGREYAITGVFTGTSIIDITDTLAMHEVAYIPGPSSDWHEMRTYKNYLYVVSEGGGGTQIIDLSNLPTSATLVRSFIDTNEAATTKNTSRVHSIEIFDGYMYLNGCANWSPGGMLIYSLANPTAPAFAGEYAGRYIHDCYVRNDTIFAAAVNSGGGIDIINAAVKSSLQLIARITYTGSGTHNTWTTKDRRYVISTDEIGSTPKTLKFWDLSTLPTPPAAPAMTYTYSAVDVEHNVTVRGDYAYTAWYKGGVAVTNITNPLTPVTAGWYDTFLGSSGGTPYDGAWAVYPYFPSGKIAISDISTGTWVFRFNNLAPRRAVRLSLPVHQDTVRSIDSIRFRWTGAANFLQDPHYYMLSVLGPGVNTNTKVNDTTLLLTNLSAYQAGQTYQWTVRSKDEVNDIASQDTFRFVYTGPPPSAPTLSLPVNGAINQALTLTLSWNASAGATTYRLQTSTDSLFGSTLFDDSTLTALSQQVGPLSNATNYFWRVRGKNAGGNGPFSGTRKFTTTAVITVSYPVSLSWGLLSLPLTVDDPRKAVLFPMATSDAYRFSSSLGYVTSDSLFHGIGYFLKFDSAQNVNITGVPRSQDTINVVAGWNLIGSLTDPVAVSSIVENPPGVILSSYYGYSGAYAAADTLKPARAYWVKAGTSGQLMLAPSTIARSVSPINAKTLPPAQNTKMRNAKKP